MRSSISDEEPEDPVPAPSQQTARRPMEDCLESFWLEGRALDSLEINPRRPDVENAILKRLGDSPISIGKSNLADLLKIACSTAGKKALDRASLQESREE